MCQVLCASSKKVLEHCPSTILKHETAKIDIMEKIMLVDKLHSHVSSHTFSVLMNQHYILNRVPDDKNVTTQDFQEPKSMFSLGTTGMH